jgi:protein-S-isoprenylcysteine O-methyltransferase Ste14
MYEAYAAMLVGVVCAGGAIAALTLARNLAPLAYTAVHVTTIVVMIVLVTLGYDSIPSVERYPDPGLSRMLYVVVSWMLFVGTLWTYRLLGRPELNLEW